MKPWETLAEAASPDGGKLVLQRRDTELVIRVDGQVLMSSRSHLSERALADVALENVRARSVAAPRVLIGGLGLGFTLRAVLDGLPATAQVKVVEISAAIADWNRTLLGDGAGDRALDDPRVELRLADVGKAIRRPGAPYDAILLDVDNGPSALSRRANRSLYGAVGLGEARAALAAGGVYAVWSAGADDAFLRRMHEAGFAAEARTAGSGGARHVLFVGTAPHPARPARGA